MSKIMAVNAGSSSIKFQLLEMPAEEVIASGVMERIGLPEGIFTLKYFKNGEKVKEETNPVLPTHAEGVELLLKTLLESILLKIFLRLLVLVTVLYKVENTSRIQL